MTDGATPPALVHQPLPSLAPFGSRSPVAPLLAEERISLPDEDSGGASDRPSWLQGPGVPITSRTSVRRAYSPVCARHWQRAARTAGTARTTQ
jgi:hypothetical protein